MVLRYWDGEAIAEQALAMEPAYDRSSEGLMSILTATLKEYGIELG